MVNLDVSGAVGVKEIEIGGGVRLRQVDTASVQACRSHVEGEFKNASRWVVREKNTYRQPSSPSIGFRTLDEL